MVDRRMVSEGLAYCWLPGDNVCSVAIWLFTTATSIIVGEIMPEGLAYGHHQDQVSGITPDGSQEDYV